jgi:glucose-6-phosphate 1-dehydrogenase
LIEAADREFGEDQIYRIDHYLARETAQNLLVFRFKNSLFETIWNSRHISSITIAAHESIDIEGRANFYENVGALRDFIQGHLMQLLCFVMMDRPSEWTSPAIHQQKLAFLQTVNPITADQVSTSATRGQYIGYREAVGDINSNTETFARLKLQSSSGNWAGTDIVLETGKALHERRTLIEVVFKGSDSDDDDSNTLTFRLQPSEGIVLQLQAKRPGLQNTTEPVEMEFDYNRSFDAEGAQPYERVIMDAIKGDQTLFASGAEVMASWNIVDAVLEQWASSGDGLQLYQTGAVASSIK